MARRWAAAGIEVNFRTSFAAGHSQVAWRDGYRVIRKAGRYMVFPRAAFSEMMGWHGARDGLVEIWNGMPFFSPMWASGPRIVFLHHVHAEMWDMVLPPRPRAAWPHRRVADRAPIYRRTRIVTLSESSKRELVEELGFKAKRVDVVAPGIDPKFSPGGAPDDQPLLVAVGRLVPVKRFHLLVDAVVSLRERYPGLRAVIVGEGYERGPLTEQIERLDASVLRRARRPSHRRAAHRPVPPGVGPREHVGPRGLGHDDHRGGGVRDTRGRHRHRGAP